MDNVRKLPDAYKKDVNSNNYKMLKLNELAVDDLKTDMTDLLNSLDIKQAFGKTLDLYGAMFREQRKGRNDVDYRAAIETAVAETLCGSDCNSIELLLSQIFGCPVGDVLLTDYLPNKVQVQRLPIAEIRELGLHWVLAMYAIEALLPVCVSTHWYNLHGTFEFAESTDDYDENAGFGNVEQTVGGFLGLLA